MLQVGLSEVLTSLEIQNWQEGAIDRYCIAGCLTAIMFGGNNVC